MHVELKLSGECTFLTFGSWLKNTQKRREVTAHKFIDWNRALDLELRRYTEIPLCRLAGRLSFFLATFIRLYRSSQALKVSMHTGGKAQSSSSTSLAIIEFME